MPHEKQIKLIDSAVEYWKRTLKLSATNQEAFQRFIQQNRDYGKYEVASQIIDFLSMRLEQTIQERSKKLDWKTEEERVRELCIDELKGKWLNGE